VVFPKDTEMGGQGNSRIIPAGTKATVLRDRRGALVLDKPVLGHQYVYSSSVEPLQEGEEGDV